MLLVLFLEPRSVKVPCVYTSLIGAQYVVIIGGCNDTSRALDDCYVLNVEESHLKMVSHDYDRQILIMS